MKERIVTGVVFTVGVLVAFAFAFHYPILFLAYGFLLSLFFLMELYPLLRQNPVRLETSFNFSLLFYGFPLGLLSLPILLELFSAKHTLLYLKKDSLTWGAVLLFFLLYVLFRFLYVEQAFFSSGEDEESALQKSLSHVAQEVMLLAYITLPMMSFLLSYSEAPKKILYYFFAFFATWASDIFAYFFGVFFGRYKILPRLSPKKTYAGFFGGLVGPIFLVFGGLWLFRIESFGLQHLIFSLLLGVLAQAGDWLASLIKRYYKIKDFGHIFPGHGGFLDRFDGVLLNFILIYFISQILVF